MAADRLWTISTEEFAEAVASITEPMPFARDEFLRTWQCSWFRFVRAPIASFESLVRFAAMAIFTTDTPLRDPSDWARDVNITPIFPERQRSLIDAVRGDCLNKDEGERVVPDWLEIDGDIIDAFDLVGRGGPLIDMADHAIYRTADSYYYLGLNWES